MYNCAATLFAVALLIASPSRATTPCDFKGVSVGSKVTPAQLMTAFGVTRYKLNPPRDPFEKAGAAADRYGIVPAAEIEDQKIGPYCEANICRIPFGVSVGNNKIPVSLFVAIHGGLITEIDVSFSEAYWSEVRPILDQKYGPNWKEEIHSVIVTDYETKKSFPRDIIYLQHLPDGLNIANGNRCQIWATNIDSVFEHYDTNGPYHSNLVIRFISKNF